jgi:hypothetical protein
MMNQTVIFEVGGNPESLCFAPNGKWGLVGNYTTDYPPTQEDIVLGVDENRIISVLGTVHNDLYDLIAISTDSRYGVYGCNLKTLRFDNDTSFTVIPTENPLLCVQAVFSKVTNNILVQRLNFIEEYTLLPDGRTTDTGFTLDISPSTGNGDLNVTPDVKYIVTRALINDKSYFYVVRIKEDGKLEYLPEKDYVCTGHVSAIAFVPPQKHGVSRILY